MDTAAGCQLANIVQKVAILSHRFHPSLASVCVGLSEGYVNCLKAEVKLTQFRCGQSGFSKTGLGRKWAILQQVLLWDKVHVSCKAWVAKMKLLWGEDFHPWSDFGVQDKLLQAVLCMCQQFGENVGGPHNFSFQHKGQKSWFVHYLEERIVGCPILSSL